MADERNKNSEMDKNLGGREGQQGQQGQPGQGGQGGQGGQQAPGRNIQDDKSTQQKPGQGGQTGQRREEEDFGNRPGSGQGSNR